MSRRLVLALIFSSCASAAIWPDRLGDLDRKSAGPLEATPDEFGREAAEQADYGSFQVVAVRYKDSTGAYAASLESSSHPLLAGNYVITCSGRCPKDLATLASALPRYSRAALPVVKDYLPAKSKIRGSERYIMGPLGLHANLPQITESAVALEFGTEGALARYRLPKGEATLVIFTYPTFEMARKQVPAYEKIPGVLVKRAGSMVALVAPSAGAQPTDPAEAQLLLAQINYAGSVSWNETPPLVVKPETAAQMVLGIITLAGIVLGFCLASGLAYGLFRIIARRFGYLGANESLTTLSLSGK